MARLPGVSPEDTRFDEELRAGATAQPLAAGQTLSPRGPCIWPEAVVSAHPAAQRASDGSQRDRRAVIASLAEAASSRAGWQSLSFRLLRQLSGGEDCFAQVWLVEASVEGQVAGRVVLKLLVEELFPRDSIFIFRRDRTAQESADAEAMAYERLQNLQGASVPICYGSFSFTIPSGTISCGIVLEDLTGNATVSEYLSSHRPELNSVQKLDSFARTLLGLVHTFHALGVATVCWSETDIVLLRESTPQQPLFVVFDFGDATTVEEISQKWPDDHICRWPYADEHSAYMELEIGLGYVAKQWYLAAYDRDPTWLADFASHENTLRVRAEDGYVFTAGSDDDDEEEDSDNSDGRAAP